MGYEAMTAFGQAMKKLTTAQGQTPESLPGLSAAILGLAVPGAKEQQEARIRRAREGFTEEQEALAAELARTTPYGHDRWCSVLVIIGDRPDRDELVRVVGEMAARSSYTIESVALLLVGDENTPGLLASGRAPEA